MFGWTAAGMLSRARRAMRARNWSAAASLYGRFVKRRPRNASAWVQYGHSLKEQGDFSAARTAYDRALGLNSDLADHWLQLGHILKLQGDRMGAIDAYASAAARDPRSSAALSELVALGARDRLPDTSLDAGQQDVAAIENLLELRRIMAPDEPQRPGVYASARYDAYRRQMTVPAPPATPELDRDVEILIDARDAIAAEVRASLSSLLDQVNSRWRATVLAPKHLREHSVASLEKLDERIRFVDADDERARWASGLVLLLSAGVILDRQAIGWFGLTAARTICVAAYCDHDHSVEHWRRGLSFRSPIFQPMFDPNWFSDLSTAPALLLIDCDRLQLTAMDFWAEASSRLLMLAAAEGSVAHIPILLATIKGLAPEAEQAMSDQDLTFGRTVPEGSNLPMGEPDTQSFERIQVIIQTRDEPDMLEACVKSLRKRASRPDCLDITIVDNRSILPATRQLLDRWRGEGINVHPLDEPFNWSRANNLAAAGGEAPLLLFLNNDMEMLSQDWDIVLRKALAQPYVGVVGALLRYPDQTIQHAGMIFGMGAGHPVHEGVGHQVRDPGPSGRWKRARSASAVTGAFMAMRRAVFDDIGHFDAIAFSIAFNDIDICLRARARGLHVVIRPDIELIHYESKTRGINVTRSQIAFDLEELTLAHRRWGSALFTDPGYNPHWTRHGQPFDGYRFPGLREVLRHIDLSARAQPWSVVPPEADEDSWWW